VRDSLEDLTTTEYLRDVATQAGLRTEHIYIDDVGYDQDNRYFVDLANNRIRYMFKLYPWEWLVREEFAPHLLEKSITLLEPAWKMVLSNKAILPCSGRCIRAIGTSCPPTSSHRRARAPSWKNPFSPARARASW
jgi:glutathionylspermidine synthase